MNAAERLGTLLGYLDYLNERVPAFLDQLRTLEANGATWLQPGEPVTPEEWRDALPVTPTRRTGCRTSSS